MSRQLCEFFFARAIVQNFVSKTHSRDALEVNFRNICAIGFFDFNFAYLKQLTNCNN